MNLVIAILIFIGLLGLSFLIWRLECRIDENIYKKNKEEDDNWLAKEMKKPKFRICFVTVDGMNHFSRSYDPQNSDAGHKYNSRFTSAEIALHAMEVYYRKGYFIDDNSTTYPTCNIKKAEVYTNKASEES